MTRVHSLKNKDYWICVDSGYVLDSDGNIGKQKVLVWNVGNRITQPTINSLEIKHKKISSNESTTASNTDVTTSLEFEKAQHEWQSYQRAKLFQKILSNEKVEFPFRNFIFFILGTIIVCPASTFVYTLIPLHNVVMYPSYWYEFLFIIFCLHILCFSHYLRQWKKLKLQLLYLLLIKEPSTRI